MNPCDKMWYEVQRTILIPLIDKLYNFCIMAEDYKLPPDRDIFPPIRNNIVEILHTRINNVITGFVRKYQDTTSEEIDASLNRIKITQNRMEMFYYTRYVWDLKEIEKKLDDLKGKESNIYK